MMNSTQKVCSPSTNIQESRLSQEERSYVESLLSSNPAVYKPAWDLFVDKATPMVARHKNVLTSFDLSLNDLMGETYIYLSENDYSRLRLFLENGSSFLGFLSYAVLASKNRLLYRLIRDRNTSEEYIDSDGDEINPPKTFECSSQFEASMSFDIRDLLNEVLADFWIKNSQQATIYKLRRHLELPSKYVAELLGLTVGAIDISVARADTAIRKHLERMGFSKGIWQQ